MPNAAAPAPEEQEPLVPEGFAQQPADRDEPRDRDGRRALDVVVEGADFVAVLLQDPDGVHAREVLPLDAHPREPLDDRLHEGVDEFVVLLAPSPWAASDPGRAGPSAAFHCRSPRRARSGGCARAAPRRSSCRASASRSRCRCPPTPRSPSPRIRWPSVTTTTLTSFDRPVFQDLPDPVFVPDRDEEPPRPAGDVTHPLARLADRRSVDERQEPRGIADDGPVEERFVRVEERVQVHVFLDRLLQGLQLACDAEDLGLHRLDLLPAGSLRPYLRRSFCVNAVPLFFRGL